MGDMEGCALAPMLVLISNGTQKATSSRLNFGEIVDILKMGLLRQ